jgi:hypothetical protein
VVKGQGAGMKMWAAEFLVYGILCVWYSLCNESLARIKRLSVNAKALGSKPLDRVPLRSVDPDTLFGCAKAW